MPDRINAVRMVASAGTAYTGVRNPISVGKFDNRSSFMRGIFTDGVDRLGSQAKTILITHLQQTGRFNVLDRDNISEIKQEAAYSKASQSIRGATYVITGDVTEFGRKETGDKQLFGLLGRGKSQVAYAKVSLNVVDVQTRTHHRDTTFTRPHPPRLRPVDRRSPAGRRAGRRLRPPSRFDYSAFKESRPASILVLPPLNSSPDVAATYSLLSQVTLPLAESGYYV